MSSPQIRQDQFPENGRATAFPSPDFRSRRLVTARRRLAMSQGELAIRLGADQSTVSRLERGEMQSPPWKLVAQACLHLELEPYALLDMEPGCETRTCRPLSIARARVSHHFLYLGSFNRLFKMLHYCIYDMSHVRPTSVGVLLAVVRLAKSTDAASLRPLAGGQNQFC